MIESSLQYLPSEIEMANRTSRAFGAVGRRAIVPRIVREWISDGDLVLDFGAGKSAIHAVQLRREGYNVVAHEFGQNQRAGLHDSDALQNGAYDIVYASNVLNVQSSYRMLQSTLMQIFICLRFGGIFIGNYPRPRKMALFTPKQMGDLLTIQFGSKTMTVLPGRKLSSGRVPPSPVFIVTRRNIDTYSHFTNFVG